MARQTEIIEHDDGLRDALGPMTPLARMAEGSQVVSERTLFGDVITAQPIRAPRDEARVLRKIDTMASAAGERWFYRFPVRKKGGGIDYIEGPTIDCADAVARYYGNCQVASAVQEFPGHWIIHSRFVDLETGYTLIRPFRQAKTATLGGDDDERRIQIALAIGTSKSQRNVIDHALKDFTTRAFDMAQRNLVERVGKRLPEYRDRVVGKIGELGPDMLARVERVYGRKAADWLAPDVARIISELRAIADGMATVDESWPAAPPPEPRRDAAPEPSAPQDQAQDQGTAGTATPATPPSAGPADASSQPAKADDAPPVSGEPQADEPPPKVWRVPDDIVGQDNVIKALRDLLDMTESRADVDELERQNGDRLAKITGTKRMELNGAFRQRRDVLQKP